VRTIYIVSNLEEAKRIQIKGKDVILLNLDEKRADFLRLDDKDQFDKNYIFLIASLSKKYLSKFWWANSLSEKNELLSKFYIRLHDVIALKKRVDKEQGDFVLIVKDRKFANLVWDLFRSDYRMILPRRKINEILLLAKNILKYCIHASMVINREIYRHFLSRYHLKDKVRGCLSLNDIYLFKGWIDHRNYENGEYEDPYYKNLPEFIKQRGGHCVFAADVVRHFRGYIKPIKNDSNNHIIPFEHFFSLKSLSCGIRSSLTDGLKL